MSLAEQLDAIREAGSKRIPDDKRAIMGQATADLKNSGILDGVPKVGDKLPEFSLTNAQGVVIHSENLLAHGAVVLTVFRGVW